jgi:hypothetical protein
MPEGKCSKCGARLSYGALEPSDMGQVFYNVFCNACGAKGKEYYKTEYAGTNMKGK